MLRSSRLPQLALLGLALAALFVLAVSLSRLTFQSGDTLHLLEILFSRMEPPARPDFGGVAVGGTESEWAPLIRLLFWAFLLFALVYAFISPAYRRLLLRTALIMFSLAYVLSRCANQEVPKEIESMPEMGLGMLPEAEYALPEPPPFIADPPAWFTLAFEIGLVLLVLAALWYFWQRLQAGRKEESAQSLVVQEMARALADLEAGANLKDAVMRCYVEMTQLLQQDRHVQRHRAMTPREFEGHLVRIGLENSHIGQLTRLFEQVRYGDQPADGRAEREAIDCLRAIVHTYGRPA